MKDPNQTCKEIIQHLIRQGFTLQVGESEIDKAITVIRGPDKRTLQNWKRALETLGFIQREKDKLWKLDLSRHSDLLQLVIVKEEDKRQAKLL